VNILDWSFSIRKAALEVWMELDNDMEKNNDLDMRWDEYQWFSDISYTNMILINNESEISSRCAV
jgi:hypothetical protein